MQLRVSKKWSWWKFRRRPCVQHYIPGPPFLSGWVWVRWVESGEDPAELSDRCRNIWLMDSLPPEMYEEIMLEHEKKYRITGGPGSLMRDSRIRIENMKNGGR